MFYIILFTLYCIELMLLQEIGDVAGEINVVGMLVVVSLWQLLQRYMSVDQIVKR